MQSEGESSPDDGCLGVEDPRSLWKKARDGYYYDRYRFRGYESLHVLSILCYERELCRISQNLLKNRKQEIGAVVEGVEVIQLDKMRELLHGHTQSVCDLETMLQREALWPSDQFCRKDEPENVPTEQHEIDEYSVELHRYDLRRGAPLDYIGKLLHKILPEDWKYDFSIAQQIKIKRQGWNASDLEEGFGSDRQREDQLHRREYPESKLVDSLGRLIIAVLGGAALLVPIIIMTDVSKKRSRLITVSVAVGIFGLVLSFGTKASNQEILAASAAYAAVLVVYIGTAS